MKLLITESQLKKLVKTDIGEDEFVYGIFQYLGNYNVPVGDLMRLNSYGIVKRNNEDNIVLIDYGLTNETYNTHYKK